MISSRSLATNQLSMAPSRDPLPLARAGVPIADETCCATHRGEEDPFRRALKVSLSLEAEGPPSARRSVCTSVPRLFEGLSRRQQRTTCVLICRGGSDGRYERHRGAPESRTRDERRRVEWFRCVGPPGWLDAPSLLGGRFAMRSESQPGERSTALMNSLPCRTRMDGQLARLPWCVR